MDYWIRLHGVDPRLIAPVVAGAIFFEAAYPLWKVRVVEGLRDEKRQRLLLAQGKTKTMFSYHLKGQAIDLACLKASTGEADWSHEPYRLLNLQIQAQAELMDQIVTWGGTWHPFVDAVHWQLEATPLSNA